MKDSIRTLYEKFGATYFYKHYGDSYENPHFEQIQKLLLEAKPFLDYSQVLDFCCGGGEVCEILQHAGYQNFSASDPYTYALFEKKFNQTCRRDSFEDVVRQGLPQSYSCIICSFAMHLCPEKMLHRLMHQLFIHAPHVVILTPHKRPDLSTYPDIILEKSFQTPTLKGKQVRLHIYRRAW